MENKIKIVIMIILLFLLLCCMFILGFTIRLSMNNHMYAANLTINGV